MANQMLSTVEHTARTRPTTGGGARLTISDVLIKTAACLLFVTAGATAGFVYLRGSIALYLGALIAVMILGVVLARRAPIGAGLALIYSLLLGVVVGAFSYSAVAYGGSFALIPQALLGTAAGVVAMLALYATPFGRKASKAVALFAGVALAYMVLALVSLVLAFLGVGHGWGLYGVGGLGLLFCSIGLALACWSLLIDLGTVSRALSSGLPATYGWTFGASISGSITWIYTSVLRLLSITRG